MSRNWAPLLATLMLLSGVPIAGAQQFAYPIKAADGLPVANHRVSAKLLQAFAKAPGAVPVGNPKGKVTVYEFYDLNCPFCRVSAKDMGALVRGEKNLKLVLVPYPVLGIPSIQAGRVELAISKLASPATFFAFHLRIFQGRGVVNGQRAFGVARDLGLDLKKLLEVANDDAVVDVMKAHARLGDALGMVTTPSFVIGDVASVGYPGPKAMSDIVRSAARCGRVMCGAS